jgi:potassium uptake TrkH family protein
MWNFQQIRQVGKNINSIAFGVSCVAVLLIIYDFGFGQSPGVQKVLSAIYQAVLLIGLFSLIFRHLPGGNITQRNIRISDGLFLLLIVLKLLHELAGVTIELMDSRAWTYGLIFLVFIREFSALNLSVYQSYLNPAQLFAASFLFIIVVGTLLLCLPRATHAGISFVDALFTATSAVCVTGLIVVDTGSYFTVFGQSVIVLLIQLGGIGMMTFTSYFSYFFRGTTSYENQILLRDLTQSEKLGEVFSTLKKIILLTLAVEVIGAVFIYSSLESQLFSGFYQQFFFSLFHSVSAFCNAGFSTLPNGLYESGFRFNYALHLTIALLFIIGGIGFPIAFNFYKYLRYLAVSKLFRRKAFYLPWVINLNTRIVLITTGLLLLVGTALFYSLEYQNTLAEHTGWGKLVTAFFGAATPRTAGFNTVDTAALNLPTLMIVFLLMWIGASPGSTGGGIKTTTFALATLNFLSLARGKNRIELFRREVSDLSVRRAFAVISLSLIVIGLSIFLLTITDPGQPLLSIAFESFSAYSTVGLSIGLTGDVSSAGKLVLIATMFIGRVSMLTILVAFFRRLAHFKYRYPSEDILIN